ncbi:MAG: metal ABC transporter permease [Acutalibacteraceae bacterium]|jgi:zinc transport system permease protein
MLEAISTYKFLQNAVIASLLAGIICGMIGVIITEKKMLMLSGGIAHTAYGGVGLGYLVGFEPIIGAGIFAVLSALIIGKINRKGGVHTDIIISLLWSAGMALGIAFTGLMPGYPPDMNSYLFGNILSVRVTDIYIMLILTAALSLVITLFFNDWKAFLFDRDFAAISGLNTVFLENLLLITISLCIVALIRVVGIILVIALLSAPAASAKLMAKTLKVRMILAILFCIFFCITGLAVSYYLGIASGATIVFTAIIGYFFVCLLKRKN